VRAGYCVLLAFECAGTGELVEDVWWVVRRLGEMWLSGVGVAMCISGDACWSQR
jgi:hypothetical protein